MAFLSGRQNAAYRLLILTVFYVICNVIVFKYRQNQRLDLSARNRSHAPLEVRSEKLTENNQPLKTILFWNTFFKADDYRFGLGREPFLQRSCRVNTCQTSVSRSDTEIADAIIFHGPRVEDFPPAVRPPGQIYVYVQEKPNYNPSVAFMSDFDGHMNLTMTNRRDSDIEFPHARVIVDPNKDRARRGWVDPSKRPRSVVWVVHRCSTPSRREWYISELKKYIAIDVFGGCGEKRCPEEEGEEDQECLTFFQEKYLFYLALEYDVCRDYVSEKIYKAFKKQIVPIVFGGANYSYVAPPKSVIDIRKFPHPKQLADYLNFLSNNEDEYNEYLQWKNSDHDVILGREDILGDNFCKLCEILHDPGYQYRDYSRLKDWWLDGICDASVIPRMRRMADW